MHINNKKEIYTIGYSAFPKVEDFLKIMHNYGISCIIDVRSNPYSAYHSSYNKDVLQDILSKKQLYYRNYKEEFGARQTDPKLFKEYGYLDYEAFSKTNMFLSGIKKIKDGIDKHYSFVLMCSEKDPIDCHRSIAIGRVFHEMGYNVKNILYNGKIELQKDLENRLVKLYFDKENQDDLFEVKKNYLQLVKDAYRKKNAEIGYKLEIKV